MVNTNGVCWLQRGIKMKFVKKAGWDPQRETGKIDNDEECRLIVWMAVARRVRGEELACGCHRENQEKKKKVRRPRDGGEFFSSLTYVDMYGGLGEEKKFFLKKK